MFEKWYLDELLNDKIKKIWKLNDYYLLKLLIDVLEKTKILTLLQKPVAIEDIISEKNYPKKVYSSVFWILQRLKLDGYIDVKKEDNKELYYRTSKEMTYDSEKIFEEAVAEAPDVRVSFEIIKIMSDNYPDFLAGKKTGVDILFSSENIDKINEYYTNNLFYNVHNIIGAKVLNWLMESREHPTILEIGGGLGGGTKQFVMQRLEDNKAINNFTYYFTDIANKMLRSTKKDLAVLTDDLSSFNFRKYNFNTNLEEQGFEENFFDVIWGVNAAHVAVDLRFTLNQLKKALKPDGVLIISETVRAKDNPMIQQEYLLNTLDDYWNVKLDPEVRPRHGFLRWSDWINALKVSGFSDVEAIPDMSLVEDKYDNCYVVVIKGVKK